ncbi:MAG: tetratricopeptide repeat protein [Alphaproteobacteria bacterium]|nr:tetratricopeptide repeat protein [Alphaproteobacteria bacterium]MBL7099858.1 tetratricopeptide repeat protein [Alphaproteobacteria bacterium]
MLSLIIYLLPTALMVLCIVHAIRHGNVFPWIWIIVFLPGIGSLIYFFMEILPELTRTRQAAQAAAGLRQMADPGRSLREAHRAAEMVGSVDAKRTLAEEYMARGNYAGAVAIYQEAAQGQFRDDPALLQGLARAQFMSGDPAGAQASLDALQAADPNFASADAHLLYARALEGQGKNNEALAEYRRLVGYYSGEEARARFGQLLEKMGQRDEARAVYQQVVKSLDGAPSRYQKAQKEWGDIARRGLR